MIIAEIGDNVAATISFVAAVIAILLGYITYRLTGAASDSWGFSFGGDDDDEDAEETGLPEDGGA